MSKKVYIATAGKYCKIGISENPSERIKQLQTGNPESVILIGSFDSKDAAKCESTFHKRFKGVRCNGEWFNMTSIYPHGIVMMAEQAGIDLVAEWFVKAHPLTAYLMCHMLSESRDFDMRLIDVEYFTKNGGGNE